MMLWCWFNKLKVPRADHQQGQLEPSGRADASVPGWNVSFREAPAVYVFICTHTCIYLRRLIYLFERITKKKKRERLFRHCSLSKRPQQLRLGWDKARSFSQVSNVGGRSPITWAIFHCFPLAVNREWTGSGVAWTRISAWKGCWHQSSSYCTTVPVPPQLIWSPFNWLNQTHSCYLAYSLKSTEYKFESHLPNIISWASWLMFG